jgi:sortase A
MPGAENVRAQASLGAGFSSTTPGVALRAPPPPLTQAGLRKRSAANVMRRFGAWLLALLALGLVVDAGWLHAKAWLAQVLLQDAWTQTRAMQLPQQPWPWADTHPVARLRVAAHDVDQIVLAGDAGRTLAFGPGWAEASAAPGQVGTSVISGHRDTHFAFLQALAPGDAIELDSPQGTRRYRVSSLRVADTRREALALDAGDALFLVTCWPFDALVAGGPLRYVVRADPAGP